MVQWYIYNNMILIFLKSEGLWLQRASFCQKCNVEKMDHCSLILIFCLYFLELYSHLNLTTGWYRHYWSPTHILQHFNITISFSLYFARFLDATLLGLSYLPISSADDDIMNKYDNFRDLFKNNIAAAGVEIWNNIFWGK